MNSFEEYAKNKAAHILKAKNIAPLCAQISALPHIPATLRSDNGIHIIAHDKALSVRHSHALHHLAMQLKPWRKGPFHLFDLHIDSEWQSFMKWQLLAPHLSLAGKKIADVGCNNGYYMFEMLCARESEADSKEGSEYPHSKSHTASESTLSDSHSISESRAADSRPLQNLQSPADSETPSGEARPLRDKNKNARSANLRGVVGERGLSRGEGATSPNSSPSPLDEKETTINEVSKSKEVKAKDSKTLENDLTTERSAVVSQSFEGASGITSAVQDPAARSAVAGHNGGDNSEAEIESRRDSECPPQGFRRRSGALPCETIPSARDSANSEAKMNSSARIIGFDPSGIFKCQFDFINHFARAPIGYELLGVEDLPLYCESRKEAFDVIFCLGVLYHRLSPIETLKSLSRSLESGGELILDTLIYESDKELCLSPAKSYARMSNVYFIPSISTLQGWCERAKLKHFEVLALMPTTTQEQRQTPWVDSQSLESFLQHDKTLTIEGYQAPIRGYFKLRKD